MDLWRRSLLTPDDAYANLALLMARAMAVLGLLQNGFRKLATFEQTALMMGGTPQVIMGRQFPDQAPLFDFPLPGLFLAASVLFDILGSLLVLFGWRTRAVASWLAVYVLIAMTIFHSDIRHGMDAMQVLRNLPLLAALLMLGAVGAGWWSLDGRRARRAHAS